MAATGLDALDKTVHKTNTLLKHIRAVLHALRDRLTVQEAADLAAQLPLLVKGIFYDGWNPSDVPKKIHKDEFLAEIRKNFTFSFDRSVNEVIVVVLTKAWQ